MLRTIQAGRGLAAIAVAAFHLSLLMGLPKYFGVPEFGSVTWAGYLGVDFFFVLSGFIIIMIHERDISRPEALPDFARKRFIRIYPIYWIYTALFLVGLLAGFGDRSQIPHTVAEWLTSVTLVRFTADAPPLGPSWTLFHEVAFYAAFSLLIVNRKLGIAVAALVTALILVRFQYPFPDQRTAWNVYTAAFNLEFLLGIGAYYLYKSGPVRLVYAFGLLGAVATPVLLMSGLKLPGQQFLYAVCFGAIIAAATKWESRRATPPNFGPLGYIGDASFSIYLTHEVCESALAKLLGKLHLVRFVGLGGVYFTDLVLTLCLGALAYLFERWLLQRIRELTRRPRSRPMATPVGLVATTPAPATGAD